MLRLKRYVYVYIYKIVKDVLLQTINNKGRRYAI